MKCQYCNSEIPDHSTFCPNCGKECAVNSEVKGNGAAKKFCENCGAPLQADSDFCTNCGKPINQNAQTGGSPQPEAAFYASSASGPQKKKGKKTGLIAAVVIICVVVLGGVGTAAGLLLFHDKDKEEKTSADVTVSQVDSDETDSDQDDAEKESSDKDDSDQDILKDDFSSDTDDNDNDDSVNSGSWKFKNLDEFINSDMMKEQLEAQISSLKGSGITAELTSDGNKLIYNFTIEDPQLCATLDKEGLDSSLLSQSSTFSAIASSLSAAVEIENPVVVVRYLDYTGTEITSMEFPGNK